jgi:hypothetical protein
MRNRGPVSRCCCKKEKGIGWDGYLCTNIVEEGGYDVMMLYQSVLVWGANTGDLTRSNIIDGDFFPNCVGLDRLNNVLCVAGSEVHLGISYIGIVRYHARTGAFISYARVTEWDIRFSPFVDSPLSIDQQFCYARFPPGVPPNIGNLYSVYFIKSDGSVSGGGALDPEWQGIGAAFNDPIFAADFAWMPDGRVAISTQTSRFGEVFEVPEDIPNPIPAENVVANYPVLATVHDGDAVVTRHFAPPVYWDAAPPDANWNPYLGNPRRINVGPDRNIYGSYDGVGLFRFRSFAYNHLVGRQTAKTYKILDSIHFPDFAFHPRPNYDSWPISKYSLFGGALDERVLVDVNNNNAIGTGYTIRGANEGEAVPPPNYGYADDEVALIRYNPIGGFVSSQLGWAFIDFPAPRSTHIDRRGDIFAAQPIQGGGAPPPTILLEFPSRREKAVDEDISTRRFPIHSDGTLVNTGFYNGAKYCCCSLDSEVVPHQVEAQKAELPIVADELEAQGLGVIRG